MKFMDDSLSFRGFRRRWAARAGSDISDDGNPNIHGLQHWLRAYQSYRHWLQVCQNWWMICLQCPCLVMAVLRRKIGI